jgi:hypothetical protein
VAREHCGQARVGVKLTEESRSSFSKLDLKIQPISRRRREAQHKGERTKAIRMLSREYEGGRSS